MKISLELWANKIYRKETNECILTQNKSPHFYKQALNSSFSFCHLGLRGDVWLGLACPIIE